ncbi:MAG: response regulator receiver protein, partial [Halothiobacillaceae bacterium]
RTILLVDDEENILSALTRLLRRDGYHILRANRGAAGLEILTTNTVGVIISDQRMPEMTGVEFLTQVRKLYPNTIRIVLSGYTDLKSVTDAINEGDIYKFLTKPWDDEQLRFNVREAFERYELKQRDDGLSEEIRHANKELAVLNRELAQRAEEKSQEALINIRALQVAHDVLANLPVAVIGIDIDGLIAVANRSAQAWLTPAVCAGQMAAEVIPPPFLEIVAQGDEHPRVLRFSEQPMTAMCSRLLEGGAERGRILVIVRTGENTHVA